MQLIRKLDFFALAGTATYAAYLAATASPDWVWWAAGACIGGVVTWVNPAERIKNALVTRNKKPSMVEVTSPDVAGSVPGALLEHEKKAEYSEEPENPHVHEAQMHLPIGLVIPGGTLRTTGSGKFMGTCSLDYKVKGQATPRMV